MTYFYLFSSTLIDFEAIAVTYLYYIIYMYKCFMKINDFKEQQYLMDQI